MSLTQFAIVKAVAGDKPLKLSDGGGLHLLVQPGGSKLWRFRYRFPGRENMPALGAFPAVSLAEARTKRDEARKILADGADPAVKRKLDKIAAATANQNTFGAVVTEHLANLAAAGCSESTISKNRWMLEDLAAPLARRPIAEIVPAEILTSSSASRQADDAKLREGFAASSARSSAMRSSRCERRLIRPLRCAARFRRRTFSIGRQSPTRSDWAACCVRSTSMTVGPPFAPHSNSWH